MNKPKGEALILDEVRILFPNFSGTPGPYNQSGMKNFNAVISEEIAAQLEHEGWNVKKLAARDETETDAYYININVSYQKRPPQIVLVSGDKKTFLDEESIKLLDNADVVYADLVINPNWSASPTRPQGGWKGYLSVGYFTVRPSTNPFFDKYGC